MYGTLKFIKKTKKKENYMKEDDDCTKLEMLSIVSFSSLACWLACIILRLAKAYLLELLAVWAANWVDFEGLSVLFKFEFVTVFAFLSAVWS